MRLWLTMALSAAGALGAGAGERPVLIFNEDSDNVMARATWHRDARHYTEQDIRDYVHKVIDGGHVTHFFACVNARVSAYPSKVAPNYWAALDQPGYECPQWLRRMKELVVDQGVDQFKVYIDECRAKGVSPWISIRMNDIHFPNDPKRPFNVGFWKEHPELWNNPATSNRNDCAWGDKAFDYRKQGVQDHMLAYLAEALERYDVDGIELDWMHFEHHCPRAVARTEGMAAITAFMRKARSVVDAAAKRRGHPVLVAGRVDTEPEAALNHGTDYRTWAKEGLVDWLIVCNFWRTVDFELPFAKWANELKGINPKVKVYPGLDCGVEMPGKPHRFITADEYAGWADRMYAQGAKGLYVFNLFCHPVEPENASWESWNYVLGGGLTPQGVAKHAKSIPLGAPRECILSGWYAPPACASSAAPGGCVDVTTIGVKNDGSTDVSDIVNAATEKSALYFPPGRYLVEKPIVLRHSICGKGFSRCPDKASGDPAPDDTRTWFISRLACDDGSQAIVSFGEKRNVNVEEVNFMCNSAETAIRVLPGRPGNYAFLSKIGIYQLGGTGISIECQGSRPVFVQDVCIWGSTKRYYEGSRGILLRAWDCRLSNVEVMAAQIGLEVHGTYTYGENLHLWTGCMAKEGDKASWWRGTRGIRLVGGAHFGGSNVYPDTCYYPFEFVGERCMAELRGIMYWDDRSEFGCEDRNGALLKCDEGADPCLKIDGGFWGVCGSDADPHWMKYLYQPKAEIRNVTVRSQMEVKGANLDTLCMNTELPDYRVSYATNGWCKVAEVFVTEPSGSCEGTLTLDDGAAWTLSFLKTAEAPAAMEVRPLNALCAGREIKAMPGDGTLKAFLRAKGPFAGRFVTVRMTPRFRPVDWGHLRTHGGAVRYRECMGEDKL